ncbi:MAG: hypothetical protein JKX73_08085 [Flavobacteriales bacterium]|nr:hypothetical protein [Flavobacteriales bacterium]
MKLNSYNKEASIIALAWPETKVRRIGVWYDQVTRWLGFIRGDYYKAGHASAVLVDHSDGALRYFDFGRYHTPEKMGRLRSENTDPELKLKAKASINNNGEIENIDEILTELGSHPATHGDGVMYASVAGNIDLDEALRVTDNLQAKGLVHYGPFDLRGTNCSRFVRDIVQKSTTDVWTKFRLALPWTLTPTTKWNVLNAQSGRFYFEVNGSILVHESLSIIKKLKRLMLQLINKEAISPEPITEIDNSCNTCGHGSC